MYPLPYSVTVRQAATVTDLVTRADVKARLGITDTDDDAVIDTAIDEASRAIEQYIGRPLGLQTYREITSAAQSRQQTLRLSRWPLDPESLTVTQQGTALTSDVTVVNSQHGEVWRSATWPRVQAFDSAGVAGLQADYRAGYLLPGQVSAWAGDTAIAAGAWVRPSGTSPFLFECTTPGTTDSTEPTWATADDRGETITDGTVVWTAVELEELPEVFTLCAYLVTQHLYSDRPAGLKFWKEGDSSESFNDGAMTDVLPPNVLRSLNGWRIC